MAATAALIDTSAPFTPSIIDFLDDPELSRGAFVGESWSAWRAVLKAAYCLPMSDSEIAQFRELAHRDPPKRRPREVVVIAGRRAGKDSIASALAAHAGSFLDFRPSLRPGERASIACLAVDRDQAKIALNYTRSYYAEGILKDLIERETADGFDLCTGATISVTTNNYRSARGRAFALVIFDEVALWRSEDSSSPDKEVYRAIVPGMATIPNSLLVMISTGYRKSGLLYEKYRKHFGKDDDNVLVIQAESRQLNPTLDQAIIDEALADDPQAAAAEWMGQFRDDIASYVTREVVEDCVEPGRVMLPPLSGVRYRAFADPSGGSADSYTLAIAHTEGTRPKREVLDAIFEHRPPFSPEGVTRELAMHLKRFGISTVTGDKYAGEFPRELFRVHGITYSPGAKPKSDLYRELLPLLNSGTAELLDNQRLINQLVGLERRTARSGKDSIDHAPGGHDDLVNAAAGALVTASSYTYTLDHLGDYDDLRPILGPF